MPKPNQYRYPILIARINDAYRPTRTDVRAVAIRVFGEILAQNTGRFEQLRRAILIARAALGIGRR